MADRLNEVWKKVLEDYPRIKDYNLQVGRGSSTDARHLEFYHPRESRGHPSPGNPFIQVYERGMARPDLDKMLLGEVATHWAHNIDPRMKGYRDEFRRSLSSDQKIRSRRRYDSYTNPESEHYNKENPERRAYEDWFEVSDLDQILGGALTGMWPAEGYTDKQKFLVDAMRAYLRGDLGK